MPQTPQFTRWSRILLAAGLFTGLTVTSSVFATSADAANTCVNHSADGFGFGVCVNQLQTTFDARAEPNSQRTRTISTPTWRR